MVFMAELFWWFEVVKPSFVQPRVVVHPQGNCKGLVLICMFLICMCSDYHSVHKYSEYFS